MIPRWWSAVPLAGFLFSVAASRLFPGPFEWLARRLLDLAAGNGAAAPLPPALPALVAFTAGALLALALIVIWRILRQGRRQEAGRSRE